jgi:hypothetical protein
MNSKQMNSKQMNPKILVPKSTKLNSLPLSRFDHKLRHTNLSNFLQRGVEPPVADYVLPGLLREGGDLRGGCVANVAHPFISLLAL